MNVSLTFGNLTLFLRAKDPESKICRLPASGKNIILHVPPLALHVKARITLHVSYRKERNLQNESISIFGRLLQKFQQQVKLVLKAEVQQQVSHYFYASENSKSKHAPV